MNARRLWQIGGAVVILAILVLGWFAAVSPVLAQVANNEASRDAALQQNVVHAANLATLKADYENIDELWAELDELGAAIPADSESADLLRYIAAAASASGAYITLINPGDAIGFAAATGSTPPAPPATTETDAEPQPTPTPSPTPTAASDQSGGVVATEPADVALLPSTQFIVQPLTITVTGSIQQAIDMVAALQTMPRVFLVTNISYTVEGTAEIKGYVYVLLDPEGITLPRDETDAEAEQPTPEPTPTPDPTETPSP